jgi:hypothetical protein
MVINEANGIAFKNLSIGSSAQLVFRREHNIVNFRNAKWKILILSY